MEVAEAFALIARAIDSGRAAHGYLVCGDLKTQCETLTRQILRKLFPNELSQVESGSHPDVVRLDPQGKSRTIKVERGKDDIGPGMRDGLVAPMSATAFSGGWKVGIVAGADRMQLAAANAFLKTLEEPTPKTLFLLLTDAPDLILPTIVSRCQRIDLPLSEGVLEGEAFDRVAAVMSASVGEREGAKIKAGEALAKILGELKDEAEDADRAIVRKAFFKTVMSFARSWMVAAKVPRHLAFRNVEAVEAAFRQSERAISDEMVLINMTCAITFPQ